MYVNALPRYEILSDEAMSVLDGGWRRIVSELGVEFMLEESVELFRAAGQKVEGEKVFLDPEFVLEQVAKVPREFDLVARNPEQTVHIGGQHMVFSGVYGPPFVREGDTRRDAKMADFENFVKLAQSFPELDTPGGTIVEPEDRPLDSRHLDMVYALQTLSDKPYMGSVISAENARDTIAMTDIAVGGAHLAGDDLADQLQLAAALGRPHAQRLPRVQPGGRGGRDDAVPADGRDVARLDPGDARAADGRGALGHRAHAARQPGLPGRLRLVPVEHRHEVGLAELRHARVGHRPALPRARSRATSGCRSAPAAG